MCFASSPPCSKGPCKRVKRAWDRVFALLDDKPDIVGPYVLWIYTGQMVLVDKTVTSQVDHLWRSL